MTYRVHLDWRGERAAYMLVLERTTADGTREHIRLVPEKVQRHVSIPPEHVTWLEDHEAKEILLAFASEARKHGFRPLLDASETESSRKHLEDMRAIAFGKLEIDKP